MHVRLETKRVGGCRETLMRALHHRYPNASPPTLSHSQLFQHKPALLEMAEMKHVVFFFMNSTKRTDVWAARKECNKELRFMSHLVHQGLPSLSHPLPRFLLSPCVSHSLSSIHSALPLGPAAFSLIHWRDFLSGQYREGPGGGGLGLWRDKETDGELGRGVSTGLQPCFRW